MTYGTGGNLVSAAEELGRYVMTEGSNCGDGRRGATVEHTAEVDFLFLFCFDFSPMDFLFFVSMVSLQRIRGRWNCEQVCVCVCVCVCLWEGMGDNGRNKEFIALPCSGTTKFCSQYQLAV